MPRTAGLTEADIAERWRRVVALTQRGVPVKMIAEQMGISVVHVYRIRAKHLGPKTSRRSLTAAEIEQARRLLDDGASFAEVARTLGRQPSVIRRRFPGRGWTPQQAGEFGALSARRDRILRAV